MRELHPYLIPTSFIYHYATIRIRLSEIIFIFRERTFQLLLFRRHHAPQKPGAYQEMVDVPIASQ